MTQVFIRLPDNLKEAMQGEAQRLGLTLNAFVLQMFWGWFTAYQTKEKGARESV